MTYAKLFSAAAIAAAVFLAPAVAAAGDQDFTLNNKTGYTVSEVYVSPHNTSNWEEDVMGDDTLENGQSVKISFSRDTDACVYDLKVTYDDDTSATWTNFNLCTISSISLFYNKNTDKTSATWK